MRAHLPTSLLSVLALLCSSSATAFQSYSIGSAENSVIGQVRTVLAESGDTLLDIARRNGLGYVEMKLVNPGLDTWLPESGAEIVLPTEFVLPAAPRDGIVLNIPEMRLYYYRKARGGNGTEVLTFPIGIGREGWNTPYVKTKIIQKKEKPAWYPPESIRRERAADGDPLPKRVGPGPDNPLGDYAMRLGLPEYLIHGTNKPWGVGMRVSHGCIRLYPEDIQALFGIVGLGTRVEIVNQPYKVGQRGGKLYLEVHPYLNEDGRHFNDGLTNVVKLIVQATEGRTYELDWELVKQVVEQARGIPIEVGRVGDPLEGEGAGMTVADKSPSGREGGVAPRRGKTPSEDN